ncbi:polysaccharide deacetylase family protein [Halostella sp. JP-L12]|nr:polysaccharide deacetylase family protein [Halostella sp. JP-L12]
MRADGRTACITLDLENNWNFESDDLQYLVFEYVDEYIEMVRSLDLPVTIFVVGEILEDRPDVVRRLDAGLDAEFHLHSHRHNMHGEVDIEREIRDGVRAFESVLGQKPRGYRAPRFIIDDGDLAALSEAGFEFDSSVCPSYRPGVYNNLGEPTDPYFPAASPELLELPISVHPMLRIPFEQSYLRLLHRPYLGLLRRSNLPDPLVFNSHLHDYFHTSAHDQLEGIRRFLFGHNLDGSRQLFEQFVGLLRERGYRFRKLGEVADRIRRRERTAGSPS